jgi:stress response protein YsnF
VERRPVDRPLTAGDRLFEDRSIEVDERAEEAVVSKEARVREELVVKKEVDERTETISDKVRSTKVDIEDERDTTRTARSGRSSRI